MHSRYLYQQYFLRLQKQNDKNWFVYFRFENFIFVLVRLFDLFYHETWYDQIGYIRARDIDFLMEFPNYNQDQTKWSLAELQKLQLGEVIAYRGHKFTKLADDLVRVE